MVGTTPHSKSREHQNHPLFPSYTNLTLSLSVLLLGGHGRISLLLTRKIIAKNWNLTSVIRNPDQKGAILTAAGVGEDGVGKNGGKVDVLVESLDEVKSLKDAQGVLERVKPDWVVWSAGMFFSFLF